MTQTFAINSDNDIYLGPDGNLVLAVGQFAVENACATASKTRLGECVLQSGVGMPMMKAIFNGVPQPAIYENALRTTLEDIEGVVNVTVLQINPVPGQFDYTATIETEYGNTFLLSGS